MNAIIKKIRLKNPTYIHVIEVDSTKEIEEVVNNKCKQLLKGFPKDEVEDFITSLHIYSTNEDEDVSDEICYFDLKGCVRSIIDNHYH